MPTYAHKDQIDHAFSRARNAMFEILDLPDLPPELLDKALAALKRAEGCISYNSRSDVHMEYLECLPDPEPC